MFTVQLNAFVQEPSTRRALAAERTVELPCAPIAGLTIILSDIVHFEIARVDYDIRDNSWSAECEDEIITPPLVSLEQCEQWYREAGFSIELHNLDDSPARRRPRHLRPVPS